MERPATSPSDNCSLESCRCGPSSSTPMSAPSTSRRLAPKSSSEICTISRQCAVPCAASLAHTSRIRSRKRCSKPPPSSRLRLAREDHPSPAARQHWLAERVLDWSGIGVTHLRPPFFLENFLTLTAKTVYAESKILLPYGQGKHAPVCGEDLARVIVGVLVAPKPHRGKTYIPTGPQSLSMNEMTAIFGRVLDKRVEYVDL